MSVKKFRRILELLALAVAAAPILVIVLAALFKGKSSPG